MCFDTSSRRIWSMVLLDMEWGWLACSSQGPLFLKMFMMFLSFRSLWFCPTSLTVWIWVRMAWQLHQPFSSGPWYTSHWVPWPYLCLSSSGALEPDLHIWWEGLILQSLPWGSGSWEIWEERLSLKAEAEKLLSTTAFSMLVVTSSYVLFIKGGMFSSIFLL